MATVISGILNQRLPWRLVLMGVALVIAVEILGRRSLAFATGSYLSIATTGAMFAGGLIRWLVEVTTKKKDESEASPGALFSSGLIAAGGVFGLLAIVLRVVADAAKPETFLARLPDWPAFWPKHWALLAVNEKLAMPRQAPSLLGRLTFGLLAAPLVDFAWKELDP